MKANANKNHPISTALIGLGNYARVIAEKMLQSGIYSLDWCVHPLRKKADKFAAQFNSKGCDDFDRVLDDPKVDSIFIITPNDSHFELIIQTLQAGKHVFVEKPMTRTVTETLELKSELDRSDRVFMVGHNYRRKNGIRFIKKLLDNGELGRPVHFEMVVSHGGAFNFADTSWRNDPQRCLGGPLSMLGSHSFEVLQYLLDAPLSVYSVNRCMEQLSPCEDTSVSLLTMESGATAMLAHHYIVPSIGYLRLEGTEGTATYEIDSNEVLFRTGRDVNCMPAPTHRHTLPFIDDRLEQVVEFANTIWGNARVETGFPEAQQVVRFIECAMTSANSRQVVRFKDTS